MRALAKLLILLLYSPLLFADRPSGLLRPALNGTTLAEGERIEWQSGHSPYLSEILSNIYQAPPPPASDLFLIGHQVTLHLQGVDQANFLQHHSLVKDLATSWLFPRFGQMYRDSFHLSYSTNSFTTMIGTTTIYKQSSGEIKKRGVWKLIHRDPLQSRLLFTELQYEVVNYYAKADLDFSGEVKINLDNTPITTGTIKLVRIAPGDNPLERTLPLEKSGQFTAHNIAPGVYQIYLLANNNLKPIHDLGQYKITKNNQHHTFIVNFSTNYKFVLNYNEQLGDDHVNIQLVWPKVTLALPRGLLSANQDALEHLPHFLGDIFNSTRLDRNGRPLQIPYANDTMDELVFLSWLHIPHQHIEGEINQQLCTLGEQQEHKLFWSATLKETEYGPWILPARKSFINWKITFTCGAGYSRKLQTIPLNGIEIGSINEFGELQAEVPAVTIKKIKAGKPFQLNWKFEDSTNKAKLSITIEATPL